MKDSGAHEVNRDDSKSKKKRIPLIFYLLGLLFLIVLIAQLIFVFSAND